MALICQKELYLLLSHTLKNFFFLSLPLLLSLNITMNSKIILITVVSPLKKLSYQSSQWAFLNAYYALGIIA